VALCAAPTIVGLAGSAWLASHARLDRDRVAAAARDDSEVVVETTLADDDRMHRVALKHEAVLDLLDDRLTFDEAVARFRDVTVGSPEALVNLRESGAGSTDADRIVHQVLAFARVQAARDPLRYGFALARLESEVKSRFGATVVQ
jgi:hypothetical protein